MLHANFIGAGRLGQNIAFALAKKQLLNIQAICNRDLSSAKNACKNINTGTAVADISLLPNGEIIWITANDDSISSIVDALISFQLVKPGQKYIHCSGVLSSEILSPLKHYGCEVASIHPLKAFKIDYLDENCFDRVYCTVEGDETLCSWLREIFSALGATVTSILPSAKATYHAAACMAANYLITLASCSEELFLEAGLQHDDARKIMCSLMQGNLDNLLSTEQIPSALTGPLVRGDSETIAMHLAAISNSRIKKFYSAAGLATLPLTGLAEDKLAELNKLLK